MSTTDSLERQLALARRELLELSTSNRLLNTKRDTLTGAAIEIKEESAVDIFRMLVTEGKVLRFEEGELVEVEGIPATAEQNAANEELSPANKAVKDLRRRRTKRRVASANIPVDKTDDVLHTVLDPDELDRRLNRLFTDRNALFQEQGINVLFLALGFLRWREANFPDIARHAPMLLIPVTLDRRSGGSRYQLKYDSAHEINTNYTLKIRLLSDFNIKLPEIPEEVEELDLPNYFQKVQEAIKGQAGWEVLLDDIVLWFFSFSKLLMYRDLDPENWPSAAPLQQRPLIRALLQDDFPPAAPLIEADGNIDLLFDPAQTLHVIDCDSSQALVIEEATRGRSLVIQGPPGTGKSQTITNLIAASVAAGRTILFVAEKMAALEVVKRRLDNIGLGETVLELHSHKTNKRAVLQEIERTLRQGSPQLPANADEIIDRLTQSRNQLNHYADFLHSPLKVKQSDETNGSPVEAVGPTPYEILSELIELRAHDTPLPDFQTPEAIHWSKNEYEKKLTAVTDLTSVRNQIGDPLLHAWRGSGLDAVLPTDVERAIHAVPQRIVELDLALNAGRNLAARFQIEPPNTLQEMQDLLNSVEAYSHAPPLDAQAYVQTAWQDHRTLIHELADHARNVLLANQELSGIVTDAAWDREVGDEYTAYRQHGQKLFRMFNASYRKARQTLKQSLLGSQPDSYDKRVRILELLHHRRKGLKVISESNVLAEKSFGRFWLEGQTDWQKVVDWEAWDFDADVRGVHPRFRSLYLQFDQPSEFQVLTDDLREKLQTFVVQFGSLCDSLKIKLDSAYEKWMGPSGIDTPSQTLGRLGAAMLAPTSEIRARMESWIEKPEGIQKWLTYRRSIAEVEPISNGELARQISSGKILPEQAPFVFRFARSEALLREVYRQHPEMETFEGTRIEKLIDDFCRYDVERIELARSEVAEAHWENIGQTQDAALPQAVDTLRREMQKQRRHLPLRQLLVTAGSAIQTVKPVFMMSPISVAQYLTPGGLEFDLLLIDEASQVRPVEALGAAARCRQIIVVGDDKQLPPTQFFGRVIGELDDEELPDMQAGDVESILGLAIARNMPQRMLRWHYRSKHESLIAVSNKEFYDNQLYVIPSPERFGELGVKLTFVENGRFLKGKNDIEALVVAEAIVQHAKEKGKWTLGVAAFSVTQRDAIIGHLEKLRRADNSCEAFFDTNLPDPFFIKNLENVQGDERDVIFVSVGYGPGEDGKVALNFGPVSNAGGERRLNVLMTRAKSILRLFTSMRAEEIDLSRATGRGPAIFREYLRYAQEREVHHLKGSERIVPSKVVLDRLATVLTHELNSKGYQTIAPVGIAGIYVDVAVIDSDNPNRCLVGISLDGDSYQSARSSRDRNRTYDGVLGAQGWVIHHIWSADWFRNPNSQLNKLIEVIESAKQGQATIKPNRLTSPVSRIDRRVEGPDPLEVAVGSPEQLPPKAQRVGRKRTATKSKAPTDNTSKKNIWATTWSIIVVVIHFIWRVAQEVVQLLNNANKPNRRPPSKSASKKRK